MRLVRLAALFGSLMLLTATIVLLVERRGDVHDGQVARARGAADAALVSFDAVLADTIDDTARSIELLPAEPTASDLDRAAAALARTSSDAVACVASAFERACTGGDLLALEITGLLLADDAVVAGDVVLGVDTATETVVAVRRAAPPGASLDVDPITAIVAVPSGDLVSGAALTLAEGRDATVVVELVDAEITDARVEPGVVDGSRLVRDRVGSPFVVGGVELVAAVDAEIGAFAGAPTFFALLIGLGSVLLVLAAITFLADRRNLEARAATDDLTGLANRREFERAGAEAVELADRFGTGLTIMVIDLNGFKQINDSLGHQYGDLVLKGTADRLVRAVRDTDVVGRWGGDEFVILLPGLDEATAIRSSMERITNTLSSTAVVGDTVMRASIGAAAFPRHGTDLDALMRTADAAMYAAKTTGVPYRVADADLARRANGLEDEQEQPAADDRLVVTTDYVGPDRRSGGVLPGPQRASSIEPPADHFDDERDDDVDDDQLPTSSPSREIVRPVVASVSGDEVDPAILDELEVIDLLADDAERSGRGFRVVDADARPVSAPRPRAGGLGLADDD